MKDFQAAAPLIPLKNGCKDFIYQPKASGYMY